MVGSSGLEPPTSRLSGARSNHLSYEPVVKKPDARRQRTERYIRHDICLIDISVFCLLASVLSVGGDEQIRTVDPLLARQVLSQLSYAPAYFALSKLNNEDLFAIKS